MFDGRFRTGVDRVVRPVGNALVKTRLSPDHLTAFGLLLSVPTGLALGTGHLLAGLGLMIFSAVPDLLDGALAKAAKRTTVRGAFFDSVSDRVSDTFILGGIGWYLQSKYGGHAAMLPFAVLGTSLLISYLRAKAESLGFQAKGGIMERAERVVLLCFGVLVSPLLIPVLWVMLGLTMFTAGQRFVKVWRQATAAEGLGHRRHLIGERSAGSAAEWHSRPVPTAASTRQDGRADGPVGPPLPTVSARWRAWREGTGWVPRSERYARGTRRDGAADHWRERRLARKLSVDGDARRRGSRRP